MSHLRTHKLPFVRISLSLTIVLMYCYCAPSLSLAQSSDEPVIRSLVERFFIAYQKEDLAGIESLLDDKSPELAATKQRIQKVFTDTEQLEIKGPAIRKLKVEGTTALVRVNLEMSAIDRKTKAAAPGLGKMDLTVRAAKEGDEWKVWQFLPSADDFAALFVAAKTDEERKSLLAAEPEMLTIEMQKAVIRRGNRYLAQESFPQAIAIYNIAVNLGETLGDKIAISQPLSNIGMAHKGEGNYAQALEFFLKSLKLATEAGDKSMVGIVLNNAGLIYSAQGNYVQALEAFQKSRAICEEIGNKVVVARAINNLGMVHYLQRNYSEALQYFEQSLKLKEQLNDKPGSMSTLNNIGLIYFDQGDSAHALDYYRRSRQLAEELDTKEILGSTILNLGDIYHFQADYDLALKTYEQGLSIAEGIGAKGLVSEALTRIANTDYSRGDFEKSLQHSERAAEIAKQIGSPQLTWYAKALAGRAYEARNQPGPARLAFEEAISVIEDIRALLAGNEQQQEQFFENKLLPYQGMAQLLAGQNKNGEALAYAERAKARVLLDVLRSGRVNVAKAMTPPEQERERKLNSDLVSIDNQISRERARSKPDPSNLADLHGRLQKARVDYESFQTSLYVAHPELRVQRGEAQPVTAEELAALIPDAPDANGALLEYVVTDDKVYLFVATRKSTPDQPPDVKPDVKLTVKPNVNLDVKSYVIDINRKDLADQAERFRKQLAARDLGFRDAARRLYDLLLKPAAAQLNGKTALIVVPDDALWELPFQALQSAQNHFLLEDYAISYAPSLTVLREMIKLRRNRNQVARNSVSLLAMANPLLGTRTKERVKLTLRDEQLDSLPEAENEVKALAQLYGAAHSKVYVGEEAREETFKAEAPNATILHLATHGILNNASPMYSRVVLAQNDGAASEDGMLEARELIKMDLKADLVVLSACETARGRVGAGEGVIGFTWALFVAGSPTTLVSQWKVDSVSTTQLMLEFHRKLKNEFDAGKKRAAAAGALRQAAIRLMRSNEYRHPFYWAGFVVVGDGF